MKIGLASLAVLASIAAATSSAAPSFVIQGDHKIGSFAVRRDGTLGGLIKAFGAPSSMRRDKIICHVRWPAIGMDVTLYNLGGFNPCARATGRFSEAVLTGRRWRTSLGLRVGDSLTRMRTLFPRATRHAAWWWLITRRPPIGVYSGLSAKVVRGRVAALSVRYPAGGE